MARKQIGKIVNFFGLKGQLKVSVTSSTASERFKPGKKILIADQTGVEKEYKVTSLMVKNDRIIAIGIEGYDDINQIQGFIGKEIYQNVRAPKGTFFYDDLVGMKVIDADGKDLGEVDHIEKMPAYEYLVIGKTTYIPFIQEKFIESIDKKTKTIVLTKLGTEAIQ